MSPIPIQNVPLFKSLSLDTIADIGQSMRVKMLSHGEVLFEEDQVGDQFYIILQGELEVLKALSSTEERLLAVCGEGEYVGEMSLLAADSLRTATVRARGETILLELRRERFEEMIEQRPEVAYHLVRQLSERLAKSDETTINDLRAKNVELAKAYEDLKAAQAELIEKEKLEHELEMARRIQTSILPRDILPPAGCLIGAKMVPARAVGGDFYDVIPLTESRVGIAIGDVSDKGVPAALFMAQVCTMLRAEARRIPDPAEVLRAINTHLIEFNQAGMFVTCIYGVYDCEARTFQYARAGHEVPIVFDKLGEISQLPHGQGMPLCIFEESPIDEQTVTLPPSSTLILYTDGGTDAMSAEQNFFGLENLKKSFAGSLSASPQELCERVLDELLSYQGEFQFDDVTLVALRTLE